MRLKRPIERAAPPFDAQSIAMRRYLFKLSPESAVKHVGLLDNESATTDAAATLHLHR